MEYRDVAGDFKTPSGRVQLLCSGRDPPINFPKPRVKRLPFIEPDQDMPGFSVDVAHNRDLVDALLHVFLVDTELVDPEVSRRAMLGQEWDRVLDALSRG